MSTALLIREAAATSGPSVSKISLLNGTVTKSISPGNESRSIELYAVNGYNSGQIYGAVAPQDVADTVCAYPFSAVVFSNPRVSWSQSGVHYIYLNYATQSFSLGASHHVTVQKQTAVNSNNWSMPTFSTPILAMTRYTSSTYSFTASYPTITAGFPYESNVSAAQGTISFTVDYAFYGYSIEF